MKVAIIFYSSHHGNTKKVLEAIKDLGDVTLFDVLECGDVDLSGYDIIGFASGIYFNNFHKSILDYARKNLPENKKVFLIHTYGCKFKGYTRDMEKIFQEKFCELFGIFGCRGYDTFGPLKLIGGLGKGRPNDKDLEKAREFFKSMVQYREREGELA